MGGSGSGGWQPTAPSSPCERMAFRATINSPQPAILSQLKTGILLTVELQATPSPAVVAKHNGQVVGAITGTQVSTLINCLQNGYQYVAEILSLNGGHCQVDVHST